MNNGGDFVHAIETIHEFCRMTGCKLSMSFDRTSITVTNIVGEVKVFEVDVDLTGQPYVDAACFSWAKKEA